MPRASEAGRSDEMPSRPGEFHPEPLTDPDLTLSRHPAFGDVGEEYNLFGARVADTKMAPLAVPASYNWLPPSDLPSGVLELADLFEMKIWGPQAA